MKRSASRALRGLVLLLAGVGLAGCVAYPAPRYGGGYYRPPAYAYAPAYRHGWNGGYGYHGWR